MIILLKDLGCTCVQAYLAFLDFGTMYNCHVATNGLVLLEILKSLYLRCDLGMSPNNYFSSQNRCTYVHFMCEQHLLNVYNYIYNLLV